MHPLLRKLQGGDQRSLGRAVEVISEVQGEPELFAVLFDGMLGSDPVIRMRCADVAEKVSASHPEYLQPYKDILLTHLARETQRQLRWHVAPMLARLQLGAEEQKHVVSLLLGYLTDSSSIVKTLAMQALADLATRDQALRPVVLLHLQELVVTGTPAMKARGKKLLRNLARCRETPDS